MSPSNADSGRRELFRAYLRGRGATYAYVLGGGAAFVLGAWRQSPLIMAAGPAAVVVLVAAVAALSAKRLAAERFTPTLLRRWGSPAGRASSCCR